MIAFIPRNSQVHRVDARVKILYLASLLLILVLRQSLAVLAACSFATLFLYLLSGISLAQPASDLREGWLFVLLPLLLHLLADPHNGFYPGIISSLSLLNIILISLLNIYTTEIKSLLQALVFFKIPSELAFILAISVRFIPLMQQELGRIRVSQAVRGYEPAAFSVPFLLLVPLLHSSLRRSMKLAISLESRGFDPDNIHIPMELELHATDYLLLLLLPPLFFLVF